MLLSLYGFFWPEPTPPGVCDILLEDGTSMLLEDGTSILLENCVVPSDQVNDGGWGYDYRKYRKYLKRLSDAADKRLYKKLEKQIELIVEEAPPSIAGKAKQAKKELDFVLMRDMASADISGEIQAKIAGILNSLDLIVEQAILDEEMLEEEMLIMAVLSCH